MFIWLAVGVVVGLGIGWAVTLTMTHRLIHENEMDCAMKLGALSIKLVEAVKYGDGLAIELSKIKASLDPPPRVTHEIKVAVDAWNRETANIRPDFASMNVNRSG